MKHSKGTFLEYRNSVYIFVPMSYKDPDEMYAPLHRAILQKDNGEAGDWEALDRWSGDDSRDYSYDRYLLRYIANRFHGRRRKEDENSRPLKVQRGRYEENLYYNEGNHFRLRDEEVRRKFHMPMPEERCIVTTDGPAKGNGFFLREVQLFTFDTGVFILAFRLNVEDESVNAVGNTIFQLKNVSQRNFRIEENGPRCSFLGLAENIGTDIFERAVLEKPAYQGLHFRYFYYQKEGYGRANILTYLMLEDPIDAEVDAGKAGESGRRDLLHNETCRRDLFFLRNGFNETFADYEDREKGEEEIYVHSDRAIWGITQEAAACLIYPGKNYFYQAILPKNLHTSYLLMYVLLLHQKYVLYLFLRNIGDKEHEVSREELRAYRDRLYRFESGYVFSHISEVPQYQGLYEKIYRNMRLEEMYQDVREPLVVLNKLEAEAEQNEWEEERQAREEERQAQEEQNKRLTGAMFMLSLLVIISALTDGFGFVDDVAAAGSWPAAGWIGKIIVIVIVAAIVATGLRDLNLLKWGKEKWQKKKK